MTIKTEVTDEWQSLLDQLSDEQHALLLDEAEHLANAVQYKNNRARISTNGALEVLFAIGCAYNKAGKAYPKGNWHGG